MALGALGTTILGGLATTGINVLGNAANTWIQNKINQNSGVGMGQSSQSQSQQSGSGWSQGGGQSSSTSDSQSQYGTDNVFNTNGGKIWLAAGQGGIPAIYNEGNEARVDGADEKINGNKLTAGLRADLGTAQAATINQLRQAFQVQKYYEECARGGTRYREIIRSLFGTIISLWQLNNVTTAKPKKK